MNRLILPMLYVCGLCFVAGASPAQGRYAAIGGEFEGSWND